MPPDGQISTLAGPKGKPIMLAQARTPQPSDVKARTERSMLSPTFFVPLKVSKSYRAYERGLRSALSAKMIGTGRFMAALSGETEQDVQRCIRATNRDVNAEQCWVRIGQGQGAELMVSGSIYGDKRACNITLRLTHLETRASRRMHFKRLKPCNEDFLYSEIERGALVLAGVMDASSALELSSRVDSKPMVLASTRSVVTSLHEVKLGHDVRITHDDSDSSVPSIVWTGKGYGVSWNREHDGNHEIWFARLDSKGKKIGREIKIASIGRDSSEPSLVWTGKEFGLSWYANHTEKSEICFARLNFKGTMIGDVKRIAPDSGNAWLPSLVWTGTGFGLSFVDNKDGNDEIYLLLLDPKGTIVGQKKRITHNKGKSFAPRLVWTGKEFGLTWHDDRHGHPEIYFARIDVKGRNVSGDIRVTDNDTFSTFPSLVWTGTGYGVSWQDERNEFAEIYFARLDIYGRKLGRDLYVTEVDAHSEGPSLVWTGSSFTVSWWDQRDGNREAYFARIKPNGVKIGADIRITSDDSDLYSPMLVWTGKKIGVTWSDARSGNFEIYFKHISLRPYKR